MNINKLLYIFINIFNTIFAFIPLNKFDITLFKSTASDLENIITLKTITSSIITNIRNEITLDNIFLEIVNSTNHDYNYILISILSTLLYGQYKFSRGIELRKINKLSKLEKYNKLNLRIRQIIWLILFIFTKDIPNAI
jgi:hypothetical protein